VISAWHDVVVTDLITTKDNVVFLGPPGTQTHLATGLAIHELRTERNPPAEISAADRHRRSSDSL
jgi:hypothetical protein